MKIPTVTAEDLANYHARVYGCPAPPASLPGHPIPRNQSGKRKRGKDDPSEVRNGQDIRDDGSNQPDYEEGEGDVGTAAEEFAEYEEDDGLGYYYDGVKRTLTDEQIAMFRHSELYAIERRREVARENREADGEDEEDEEEGEIDEDDAALGPQDDETLPTTLETAVNVHKTEMLEKRASPSLPQPPHPTPQSTQLPRKNPTSRNQRRKRNRISGPIDQVNQERHSRAQIRELDATAAPSNQALVYDDEELDYGEDAAPPPPPTNDTMETISTPKIDPPREGKKIWWPVLAE